MTTAANYRAALEERQNERRDALARVEALKTEEQEARRAALAAAPGKTADAPAKLRKEQEEIGRRIEELGSEIDALSDLAADAERAERGRKLDERINTAAENQKAELAAYASVAKMVVAAFDGWLNEVVPAVEQGQVFRDQVERDFPAATMGDRWEEWSQVARPAVEPVAVDFIRFCELIYEAAADPRHEGYRTPLEPVVEASGTISIPQVGRTDRDRVLPTITPDMRAKNRHIVLLGTVEKTSSTPVAILGYQPQA